MAGEQPAPSQAEIVSRGKPPKLVPTETPFASEAIGENGKVTAKKEAKDTAVIKAPKLISPNPEILQEIRSKIGDIPEDATVDSLMEILTKEHGWDKDSAPLVEAAFEALKLENKGQNQTETQEGDDQTGGSTSAQTADEDIIQDEKEPGEGKESEKPQTQKVSDVESDTEQNQPTTEEEQPEVSEIPLSQKVHEAWQGEDGAVMLVTKAIEEGKFALKDLEDDSRKKITDDLGIIDTTDLRVYEEFEFREKLQKAISEVNLAYTKGKQREDKNYEVIGDDGSTRIIIIQDHIGPIIEATRQLANETEKNAENQTVPTERAKKAQEDLDVLEPILKPDPNGGYYFDIQEEIKEPQEPPEITLLRLQKMVDDALRFLALPDHMDNDNKVIVAAAMDAYGQLVLVSQTEAVKGGLEPISNAPPEVRIPLARMALNTYQEFRRKVTTKGKKAEDSYSDWQEVQKEIEMQKEGNDEIKKYFRQFVEDKGSYYDERIDKLIEEGHFVETMSAVFTASYFGKIKDRYRALKASQVLKKSGLAKKFSEQNSPWISHFMEAFFGNLTRQEEKKKLLKDIFDRLPINKWREAAGTVGGMFIITAIGKFDELMNFGTETASGSRSPQAG
ncbi:MAG: hypothetical protein UV73_C0004G0046 [Candidatus Gottesmanbacteria bacterium GW2011_GWA2_43_14]|uniref:Uncharacterized protein n=1 Tax=Candidatus Gottesmanbacteria bacterium GW2011_GWA2_43_14 TaxID=1618443 RepID=A0A0G1DJQ8_9BACT|nr:MAG: hypothetical protein UV73_C0004G0046 [Candidatus Gottesmanbacteria bacterium GW2011_GWA2_43_14]